MSTKPAARLSSDEILALKFAAHRQLSRWANRPSLTTNQQAQRAALKRAGQALQDKEFAHGCELRTRGAGESR
jgi:hypothetical protein